MKKAVLFLALVLSQLSLAANAAEAPKHDSEIASVEVKIEQASLSDLSKVMSLSELASFYSAEESVAYEPQFLGIDHLIILGKELLPIASKILKVIRENAATTEVKSARFHVVPSSVSAANWEMVSNWNREPINQKINLVMKSFAGFKLAEANIVVLANHGGSIQGRGQFLKNVRIAPWIKVVTGNDVSVELSFGDPINVASEHDPVASLDFELRYRAVNKFTGSVKDGTMSFNVSGDGKFRNLTPGNN